MGSTPIEDFVRVAKWISRPTSNREIAGSIPAMDGFPLFPKVEMDQKNPLVGGGVRGT